mmetsp:Transcript_7055/g.26450  ORF Transcript_7055/g.26450 Transcript_7055/m.26450 type:complete len:109 (+) Transcript_7055:78-404(+)
MSAPYQSNAYSSAPQYYTPPSGGGGLKDENMVLMLALVGLLTGLTGIHRIYLGFTMSGLVQLLFGPIGYIFLGWLLAYIPFFWIIWIWVIVDMVQYKDLAMKANYRGF